MKIIGKAENGDYIAVVSHSEIEKSVDKYYGNLPKLDIGASFNLGQGYDFRAQIQGSCRTMTDAVKQFESARATLFMFAAMIAALPDEKPSDVAP